ncbi:hypothetical protein CMI47_18480 [Candidatus Pacearchaeota archaeon]|nr:hypothetical protein [Candidatus Pacearchaeota archaeon]|tara:strand:- start:512 stop:1516 length:1005 start_codon:yes stop_codon:yes gene_type:complete
MAFLDNSGDIILDAVLTDLGRKKMAQGNFKITKYAFGDDEINYALYNKNHVSGSPYYDLEILQTPIFEAFAYENIGINYGLTSYTKTDLLYLPELVLNQVTTDQAVNVTGAIMYLAVNSETANAMRSSTALGDAKYFLESNSTTGYKMILETGFNTDEIVGDITNRQSLGASNNLIDSNFNVYVDRRFIGGTMTPTAQSRFTNTVDGSDRVNMKIRRNTATSKASGLENYSVSVGRGIADTVYAVTAGGSAATDVSAIKGPRLSAFAVNFTVQVGLNTTKDGTRDTKFTKYGSIGQTVFPDGYTYDYIDTEVIIEGTTTGARFTQGIRLIRRAS